MLEIIEIFIPVMFVISVPFLIMYFISRWRKKRLTPEKISKQEKSNMESWRLFGFILIISSLGLSVGGHELFSDVPFWLRAIIFLFGLTLVILANKALNKKNI